MSKPLVQQAKVKTNTVKDSVCKIDVPVVKFAELWDNYVTGSPYKPGPNEGDYGNQCALRMSATFHKVGIQMKSFSQKTVKPMPGTKVLGRVLMNKLPAASRAYELGEWLKLQPFCGLPKEPETITGKDWESKVRGRTGIIMFHAYWTRDTDSSGQASGGHIDLWNGEKLTGFGSGLRVAWNIVIPGFWADFRNSKIILFFPIQ